MRRLLAVGLILFGGLTARAEGPMKVASIEGVTEYRLANGARVLLFPEMSRPTVTVNMTVLVGSRNEGYGETGMAHLLEHMVFKGTPNHPLVPKARFAMIMVRTLTAPRTKIARIISRRCPRPTRTSSSASRWSATGS